MDIRQLRAGNLVTTNGKPMDTHRGGVYKVVRTIIHKELTTELAVIETTSDNFHDETSVIGANLEPIEITYDLLLNIGFKLENYKLFVTKIDKYEICIFGSDSLCGDNETYTLSICDDDDQILEANVVYLHTLQNLIFDMTDLELDVENLISK